MSAGICCRQLLKKIGQRLSRFIWPFFQDPVAGVRQHNDLDIVSRLRCMRARSVVEAVAAASAELLRSPVKLLDEVCSPLIIAAPELQ